VWRNNLNQTVALDSREMELPALQPLDEASASSTEQCNAGCDWRYHVRPWAVGHGCRRTTVCMVGGWRQLHARAQCFLHDRPVP
jgi:hypothetical protein